MSAAQRPAGIIGAGSAEFRKIWDSGVPLIILSILPIACFLFVFELLHIEKATERLAQPGVLEVLGLLYFAAWKSLLLPATMLAFAAYWTTVDCQYGMIRVACCQPLTRATYLAGKWLGIGAWVALFAAAFVAILVAWTITYVGIEGLGAAGVMTILRFGLEVVVFVVALAAIGAAAASFRTTVGAGIVTAVLSMILLGFATMLPFDLVPSRFVLARYFFFALGELPAPPGISGDSPWLRVHTVADFHLTAVATPVLFLAPALLFFMRRDIKE